MQQTLQTVIDIRKIKYTYKKKVVLKTFSKTITISDPVKPNRKQLEDLKNAIGKLPDSWDKADTAKAAHAANNKIKQAIGQVVENIDKQAPMIESVQLDLGNPVKSIDSITAAFADLLSADEERTY